MAIDKISGKALTDIDKISGIATSAISKFGGQETSAASLPVRLSDLASWTDPADNSVGDTVMDDKTYNNYGPYSSTSNHINGANGAAIVDLSGTKCMYLDGVNDRGYTQNVRNGTTNIWKAAGSLVTFTSEIWIRSNGSWVRNGNIINMGYNSAYRNRMNSNGTLWAHYRGLSDSTSSSLATNTWHHLVFSMTGSGSNYSTMNIYRNGTLFDTRANINRNPSYPYATRFFGGYGSTSESQRFYMGIARHYEDRALTQTEAAANFDLEKANYGY
tara:strand:- start:936 stop:1754 length:819 start_codon:yes stop_codon:yes gene_type:complete